MTEKFNTLFNKTTLPCGAQVVWVAPTGGFGHIADEQPMPYINFNHIPLTPRFGGEESEPESSIVSLPLPWGVFQERWPFAQKLFNLFRRRINIYWRNLFNSFNRNDRKFFFAQQLKYVSYRDYFEGSCPLVRFRRAFSYIDNEVLVSDIIQFKRDVYFSYFNYAMLPSFDMSIGSPVICEVSCDVTANRECEITSSTGRSVLRYKQMGNKRFNKGDTLKVAYHYKVKV